MARNQGGNFVAAPPELDREPPADAADYGIDAAIWRSLRTSVYPGATDDSILAVGAYCRARRLDPMAKPVHIVPLQVTDARTGERTWRDVIMPGIAQHRITAMRTGEYAGQDPVAFGPETQCAGVRAPEWCSVTVYRLVGTGERVPFPATVRFSEYVGTAKDGSANQRWKRAPYQMLEKCAEAAALRKAFPEEIGGETTIEESDGITIGGAPSELALPAPAAGASNAAGTAGVRARMRARREPSPSEGVDADAPSEPEPKPEPGADGAPKLGDVLSLIASSPRDEMPTCLDLLNSLPDAGERREAAAQYRDRLEGFGSSE